MRKIALAAAALACTCAACGSARTIEPKSVPGLVLQPKDLPSWTRFQNDAGTVADAGILASKDRNGAGIARFRSTRGILVSRVDLYRNASAAHAVFAKLQSQTAGGVRPIPTPALGDEHVGYVTGETLLLKSIFWRRANAIGSIVVEGRDVAKPDADALATTMDARMKAAG
jgi:hypothetical protein